MKNSISLAAGGFLDAEDGKEPRKLYEVQAEAEAKVRLDAGGRGILCQDQKSNG